MSDESMEELPDGGPSEPPEDRARPYVAHFEWLPPLTHGDGIDAVTFSEGLSINSFGVVAGIAPGAQAFRWGWNDLELVTPRLEIIDLEVAYPQVRDLIISDAGTVVGSTWLTRVEARGDTHPAAVGFIWEDDARDLGLPTMSGEINGFVPTGLNESSTVVGVIRMIPEESGALTDWLPWIVPAGEPIQLVPLPTGLSETAARQATNIRINNSGDMVLQGRFDRDFGSEEWSFLITAEGTEVPLPIERGWSFLGLYDSFQALAVNFPQQQSAVYDFGSFRSLGDASYVGPSTPTPNAIGTPRLIADAMNDEGLVVGYMWIDPHDDASPLRPGMASLPLRTPFVWHDDALYNLKALVQSSTFADLLGDGYLATAVDVANDGWITGTGFPAPEGETGRSARTAFRMQLDFDIRWLDAVDGLFADGSNWTTSFSPTGSQSAMFDAVGAYVVTFDADAAHGSATVLAGDVSFALDGHEYRLQSLSVQSTDDLSVAARVLGTFETEDGVSAVRLPDGRLTVDDVFVGPRGILSHDGWLLVGDVFLDDFETAATRDGTDVDLHVIDRLQVAAGGRVGGAEFDYGAIVDGAGETGLVQIDGLGAIMHHVQIDVGGVHGGLVEVTGGGQLVSDAVLAVGADVEAGSRVRVAGFAVDDDGGIIHSAVEASTILLGLVGLPPGGPREGALLVEERGHVYADEIRLGFLGGMRGELEVRGEGSRLAGQTTTHSLLEVGVGGEGLMLIREGAQVFAATTIGGSASVSSDLQFGDGQVSVMGQGADVPAAFNTLLDSPLLVVGETGTGGLLISDGGRVETNRALIGEFDTGFGSVIVVGEGSILDLSFADAELSDVPGPIIFPELWVGREGGARLQVLDGGSVVVAPDNAGVMHVGSALVEIRNGGSITSGAANIGTGATVIGDDGSWHIPEGSTINLGGRLEIGSSPGRFLIDGDLTVLETGAIEIEFAGLAPGQFDVLEVTGDLYLGGTLELSFIDGYQPGADDVFDFLKVGGSVIGDFDQVVMSAPDAEPAFDLIWEDGGLRYVSITLLGLNDLGDLNLTAVQDSPPVSGSIWPGQGETSLRVSAVNGEAIEDEVEIAGALGLLRIGSDGAFRYDPNAAQRLPEGVVEGDVFVVTVTDQDDRSTDVTIDINVAGINDPASIAGDSTGLVVEGDPDRAQVAGVLSVTDPDAGEDRFAEVGTATLAGDFGTFAFGHETGAWSYALDNDASAVQALPEGAEVADTLTVSSLDGTASETITVTIRGAGVRETGTPEPDPVEPVPAHTLEGLVADRGGRALEGVEIIFSPDDGASYSAEADSSGSFGFELDTGMSGHLDATRPYDPVTDGRPSALDALDVLRLAVGLTPSFGPATPEAFIAADINADGRVTALDALEVLRAAVGLESEHGPRWVFVDADADLTHIDRDTVEYDTGVMVDALTQDAEVSMTGILLGSMQEFA
ncbi:hypothetical protein HUK65_14620 [Rhodobacteraceae bacterium 2376]|uniref:Uncharacterized protein n=1 Tax=Rhabdonatronobacter sediminivivens TaxID=2743469 RepID=A0A7Z0L0H7_9RHOB|nr:VCBS domain-containing protein [Rhabdonatronobacter sediminivivens]NYS26226.1 hypothetical protein [Rhabdonatronobacter sediminivivens]